MNPATPAYDALVAHHERLHRLEHFQTLGAWDRLTFMPAGGAQARAAAQAALGELIKGLQEDPRVRALLAAAAQEPLDGDQARNLALMQRSDALQAAVPAALESRRERCTGAAMQAWSEARTTNDWNGFAAAWEPLVAVLRERAARIGDALGLDPMDALLETHEPGLRLARVEALFGSAQRWLPALLRRALARQQTEPAPAEPQGPFPAATQKALCERVMAMLGFDFEAGRLDTALHPFTAGIPEDVRLATRFDANACLPALIATLHETGHACYQQNLPRAWLGQPFAGPHSASLHEGQALCFERQLAPTPAFVEALAPMLAEAFGAQPAFAPDNLLRLMRRIRPGRIRTAADELSYPLHIILRTQVECALIRGDIEVADVPALWNERMAALLDADPAGPFSEGPLQDPHWAQGMVGYFPSYLLGAMVAAQCFAAARRAEPALDAQVAAGNCSPLAGWLRANIWSQGARFDLDDLLQQATGSTLGDEALRLHLEDRHGREH
jgi:carboxypeptidase Taq